MRCDGELLYSMLKTGEHVEFNEVRDKVAERLKERSQQG